VKLNNKIDSLQQDKRDLLEMIERQAKDIENIKGVLFVWLFDCLVVVW
jgi:hypothetical protein